LFFSLITPADNGGHFPDAGLLKMIEDSFGSFGEFKAEFTKAALDVFGSGWVCLAAGKRPGALKILSLHNQETAVSAGYTPLILLDVWEHAYYLKYRNARAEYVDNYWNIVKFPEYAKFFDSGR